MEPLQVAKSSAYGKFSSSPTGNFIFQKAEVVTRDTPTLDLNLTYKDDNVGEKKNKVKLGKNCIHHFRGLKGQKTEC